MATRHHSSTGTRKTPTAAHGHHPHRRRRPRRRRPRPALACGHRVVAATDGASALAHAGAVDLAVLDVSMPVLDGREVIAHLRTAPHTRDLPVLVLSGLTSAAEISAALGDGADDYLTKPVVPFEVRRRVERLLGTTPTQRRVVRRQAALRREIRTA